MGISAKPLARQALRPSLGCVPRAMEQSPTLEESSYGRGTAKMVCFGPFKLDLKVGELHLNNRTMRLQEQLFRVLKMCWTVPAR